MPDNATAEGYLDCLMTGPLCTVAQGLAQGLTFMDETPREAHFSQASDIVRNVGPLFAVSFRLDSIIQHTGPGNVTVTVRCYSALRGRALIGAGVKTFTPNSSPVFQTWFAGPCPITERFVVVVEVVAVDSAARPGIEFQVTASSCTENTFFFGEGVTAPP